MCLSTKSKACNDIVNFIEQNIKIFSKFKRVYLFGSVIKLESYPKDIDLLLVYTSYLPEINNDMKIISCVLFEEFEITIDLTVLSEKELKQTKFMRKINNYFRIK